jgi:hypothetical protein
MQDQEVIYRNGYSSIKVTVPSSYTASSLGENLTSKSLFLCLVFHSYLNLQATHIFFNKFFFYLNL